MSRTPQILDLNFLGLAETITVYLIPHEKGVALVECGPGSTLPALAEQLRTHGYVLANVSDVFLTHIHLDHAGAAGALARQGARIHVHPKGAKHLIDPEKLLNSATRIYGDAMQVLWGEFLPVPESQLNILFDGEEIALGKQRMIALHTPGHADHHIVYLYENICFSGDTGGIRLPGQTYISIPLPPPDIHLGLWRDSLKKIRLAKPQIIAPTHFGFFEDADNHLTSLEKGLKEIEDWIEAIMPADPTVEEIDRMFKEWTVDQFDRFGLSPTLRQRYEAANPSFMAAAGIYRYWHRHCLGNG